ncbi:hypothetical protein [Micromonospora parathelypteridis]|uniref:Uncharacterized protein n=1 Tax=Micromonospora parathelypteridis TaxID=1839617 RepID=A0A840VTY1_9ACTN|nr:hypothetical protein [Micromonospora parathelypteridis]MBB5476030.1 hypothetical protein [Micromonospora parathelypteridis]GGO32493.1 hypothetical protein GCM10011576_62900 [Micromonospora parathelypteridis]
MTMLDDQRITELLRSASVPEPRVDVGRAIRDGRRRRRRRRVGGAVAGTVLAGLGVVGAVQFGGVTRDPAPAPPALAASPTVGTPAAPASSLTCEASWLPQPIDGPVAVAIDVDPTGRHIVGEIGTGNEDGRVVLWTDGQASVLPAAVRHGNAVNAEGYVIGTNGDGTGWVYRNGSLRTLATPPGYDAVLLYAINGRGDIAGTARGANDSHHAVLWSVDRPQEYRLIGRPGSTASGITEDGTVVGTMGQLPYRWTPQGTGTALPLPDGSSHASVDSAQGKWAIGMVPGAKKGGAVQMLPVRWDLTTGAVSRLPFPGAAGIAGNGDLLVGDGAPLVVAPDGTSRRLPGRPDVRATEAGTYTADGISDDGLTVVGAVYENEVHRPLVWRCTRD